MSLVDPPRDLIAILDVAKCADLVLLVLGPHASLEEPSFDAFGYRVLTALKAQGLPAVMGAAHGDNSMVSAKKATEGKKFVTRYFATELGEDTKLFHVSTDDDTKNLVRALSASPPKSLSWREDRSYMLAQEVEYSSADGVLCLRGYVRGPGLRCQHLAHITGHGDFAISRIAVASDPCPLPGSERAAASADAAMSSERVVDELAGGQGPDMKRLQPYDPTLAEQTWPTNEELGSAATDMPPPRVPRRRRHAGGSVPAPDGEDDGDDGEDDGDDAAMEEDGSGSDDDHGTIAETEGTEWDVSSNMTMEVPNAEAVDRERKARAVLKARSQEELEFPDEVDTPLDRPAKERFQKFRGLKSFRTSPWDPYEELPVEYSRVWEFESFNSTARVLRNRHYEVCSEPADGGVAALYCAVYLRGVPPTVMDSQPRTTPFVLSSVFDCEQKVSVVHGEVARLKEYTEVIKSKQELMLHCGFRRFPARPNFSEIPKKASTSKKFRFMRFLHQDVTACASFYAPVLFPPCRMLVFAGGLPGDPPLPFGPELVAAGKITGADPKQLIIKKCSLTGYPFRTHKSKGVVRFMFFNPADVKWFKPVELSTKKGLRGHIIDSLGTHGYMKCRFSGHVGQDDTVCMNLYKRVYPKWHPPSWGGRIEDTPETA